MILVEPNLSPFVFLTAYNLHAAILQELQLVIS